MGLVDVTKVNLLMEINAVTVLNTVNNAQTIAAA